MAGRDQAVAAALVELVQALAGLGLKALVVGAVAGLLLPTMLVYGALVLGARRRPGADQFCAAPPTIRQIISETVHQQLVRAPPWS
jgi:hypothetical protein